MLQRAFTSFKRQPVALLALFFALGGTSLAVAGGAGPGAGKRYYACVTALHHTLNLTDATTPCPEGQRKIAFNSRGVRGRRGPAGVAGPEGPAGEKGAVGPAGPAGEQGKPGEKGATGVDGAVGPQGDPGPVGAKGETGDEGPQGPPGPKGDTGDTGAPGPKGDTGDTGPAGPKGDKGDKGDTRATGATGPAGAQGPPGPPGPSGGGVTLTAGDGTPLGRVLSSDRQGATVLTSTGYIVTIPWTGQFRPAQIYYTGQCGNVGTGWLNSGDPSNDPVQHISGKWLVYSGSLNSLMEPDGVAGGTIASTQLTAQSIDNPDCSNFAAATRAGWKLKPITNAAAGLPNTITTPITAG